MLCLRYIAIALVSLFSVNIYGNNGEIVDIPLQKIYTPHGLDTSEKIHIVVEAKLPDYCFDSTIEVKYEVNSYTKEITFYAYAPIPQHDDFCIQSQKTLLKEIVMGNLERGEWKIILNKDTEDYYETNIFINDQLLKNSGILKLAI